MGKRKKGRGRKGGENGEEEGRGIDGVRLLPYICRKKKKSRRLCLTLRLQKSIM